MNDVGGVFIGIAITMIAVATWNWLVHSKPTVYRLELRWRALVRARALYAAELAGLQAFQESQKDAEREVAERTI